MNCEVCGGETEVKNGKIVCKKCGHVQRPKRSQYTYPLGEGPGEYAKKPKY